MATQRNLICHLYPRHNGGHWRATVRHLLARWSQFNGVKTVTIGLDQTTDSPDDVVTEFGDAADSVAFHWACNTDLQEVQQLGKLLESVADAPGLTLYAHGKGATHLDTGAASHAWRDAMAAACLDYPALVDCCLKDAGACGAFRSTQRIGHSPSPWHFAGTWFWMRNDLLFSRNWGDWEQVFWGTESYPGRHFSHAESRCLFFDNAQTAHLYGPDFWRQYIGPSFRGWQNRLAACGLRPLCNDPPLSQLGREISARKQPNADA